ncbi:hypothetical protein O0I10_002377 [Lichtheimia ornata]|uniref:Uncharacterized protein n=1 Tax=Lichtheimia ornata TaxID=688661 RepID=A0AAD7Y0Y0_9FUNG|nr:uncharacterized protein O0I10_002377 [Lichtheimia ornata]KAJ8662045.1 hypothetical protein O0I10_002377 [Lichtheimia ornata]
MSFLAMDRTGLARFVQCLLKNKGSPDVARTVVIWKKQLHHAYSIAMCSSWPTAACVEVSRSMSQLAQKIFFGRRRRRGRPPDPVWLVATLRNLGLASLIMKLAPKVQLAKSSTLL